MNGMNTGMPGLPPTPGGTPGMPGAPAVAPAMPQAAAAAPPVAVAPAVVPGQPIAQKAFAMDMAAISANVAELIAMQGSKKRTSDFYSFKTGRNFIRILPPWSQEAASRGMFAKHHMTHYGLLEKQTTSCWGASQPNKGFVCPICHIINTYGRYMGEALSDSDARGYHYANAIVYDTPDNGATFTYKRLRPYVLKLPSTVWTGLMQMMQAAYIGDITNLETGWIVAVDKPATFKGKNSYTWGHVVQGPLAPDEGTKGQIIADMHDLDIFGDFGVPTVEKLQRQFQLAEALLQWCVQGTNYQPEQIPGFGKLELVIPQIVYQVHGQAQAVTGMPGSMPPMAAGPVVPTAGAAPTPPAALSAPQPGAAPAVPAVAAPAAPMPGVPAPVAAPVPGQFPGMGALANKGSIAMPGVPAVAPMAPMPAAPAAAPMSPAAAAHPAAVPLGGVPVAAPATPMPGAVVAPAPAPATAAPAPVAMAGVAPVPPVAAPGGMPGPAPAAPPPAPAPMAPAVGGVTPPPFPPAPAPQQEAQQPSGAGANPESKDGKKAKKKKKKKKAKAKKKSNGKVKCPGCGNDYSGSRGLTMHLKKSVACQASAAEPPVSMEEVAPAPVAPAAPAGSPAGMAPPNWQGETPGPLAPT